MDVKIKTKDFLVDANIEMKDGVMLVSPVADVQLGKEKKTIKERFDVFIEELKKDYPNEESEDMVEAFVLVGVRPLNNGMMDCYGFTKGNSISKCAALMTLFENEEVTELLGVAGKYHNEYIINFESENKQEEQP